jgi:hypothetical protein
MRSIARWAVVFVLGSLACMSVPVTQTPVVTSLPVLTSTAPSTETSPPAATSTSTSIAAVSTPEHPGWLSYSNEACNFQLSYPPDGVLTETDGQHARIDLTIAPGTNLREKYAQIDVEPAATPCLSPLAQGYDIAALNTSTVTVNGVSYLRQQGSDAGAGNFYDWVAYSTSADCGCVSLSFVLHSLNAMNFPTPPPLFDPAAESAVLDDILSTLTWGP